MLRGVFVTGTDTDAGKTIASACLVRALNGCYWKPVQSGIRDLPGGDTATVARLTGRTLSEFPRPFCELQASLSPDQAAEEENVRIDADHIALPSCVAPLVVEGAGGLMVPVNDSIWMIDLAERFKLPVVLVARTGLGTINHTILSIEAMKRRALPIAGILFSGPDNPRNIETIRRTAGVPILGRIPWMDPLTSKAVAEAAATLNIANITGE